MPDHHRLPLLKRIDGAQSESQARGIPADGERASVRSLDDARERRDLMQIGDLARETGKTVRAIHLYEELGLLSPAARSKGRFRLYTNDALMRIRWIGKLQEMGFSLGDIQTIVREWELAPSAPGAMKRMREVYSRKLDETREEKRRIEALAHDLEASLDYLDTCDVCDPQRLLSACDCCDLHDKEVVVPELVLGFRAARHPEEPQEPESAGSSEGELGRPRTRNLGDSAGSSEARPRTETETVRASE
jgi:MerR family copper efflux transcriptional regulator